MLRGIFVTGTDTNVGKTVVSAAVMLRFRRTAPLRYWKPVQTGIEEDDDTETVRRLASCGPDELLADGVRLPRPLSPHLAASLSGTRIDVAPLAARLRAEPDRAGWVVEGAGGALVPLNDTALMTDLMSALALPALLVTRSTLGTINHTLLTLEALRARSIDVAGVVMVGGMNDDNRIAIETYGKASVVGQLPRLEPLSPDALARWAGAELDRDGRLERCFR